MIKKLLFLIIFSAGSACFLSGEDISLSLESALTMALDTDWRIQSAYLDKKAAQAMTEKAERDRWFPSLTISGAYTRLSHVDSSIDFGATSIDMDSNDNSISFAANLNYTVFAGFRLREARELAELQEKGKEISLFMTRQAVVFETKRAYWEAVRASNNYTMLEQNLSLMNRNLDVTKNKFENGTILKADLLKAEMRVDQAEMDLEKADLYRRKAFLNLQILTGAESADGEIIPTYTLTSDPAEEITPDIPGSDELIQSALSSRPESLAAGLAVEMSQTGLDLTESSLYPVVTLTGNFTLANPNSRVFLSDAEFTGTWYAGINLSYDLGRLPSHLSERKEKEAAIEKSRIDRKRQLELIEQDVRNCLLNYRQAVHDLASVQHMMEQARENERVISQKVTSGTAGDLDNLQASLTSLQAEFSIIDRQIDLQIAAADLIRASALSDLCRE